MEAASGSTVYHPPVQESPSSDITAPHFIIGMPASYGFGHLLKKKLSFKKILAVLQGLWDLSSLTMDQIQTPALDLQSPNHWIVREFPHLSS